MNDVFSIRRFGWLMRKTVQERPAQIIGAIGLSFTISFICYGLDTHAAGNRAGTEYIIHCRPCTWRSVISILLFLAISITMLQALLFLTLPASRLEKWLSAILVVGVLYFFLFFLLFFRLVDLAFVCTVS